MKTLAIVSQKGGVGKTTLATALAVEAVRRGQSVVIIDLDPQASASFWKDTRQETLFEDPLAITAVPASRLAHVLAAAENAGCDLAVIDTPPFSKDIAYEATQRADFVLIPTRPAVLDVMAMTRSLDLVKHYERPYAVAITFCPHQGREVEDTERAIRELEANLCPVRIGSRIAYSRAQQTGRAAQEIDPGGKAAQEIAGLYDYMGIHIGAVAQEGVKNG
ncbi:AAA family ATPase [Xanthobacter sp. TB0136]|uniref:AAA family ATPase n=1 Tax=Xanthobacter sp. TB0136 TaxID=3459177 RepID=UPI00403A18B8